MMTLTATSSVSGYITDIYCEQNPQIGRNLYLHPVNMLGAFWNEDVNPMDGKLIQRLKLSVSWTLD